MDQAGSDPMMMMIPMAGCMVCCIGAILYYMLVVKPQEDKTAADAKAAAAAAAADAAAATETSAPIPQPGGSGSATDTYGGSGTQTPPSSGKYRTLNQKRYVILEGANAITPSSQCANPKMSKNTNSSDQIWNVVPYAGPNGSKAYKITSASKGCARAITAPTCNGRTTLETPSNKTTQLWNLGYAGTGNKTTFQSVACPTNSYLRSGTTGAMGMGSTGTTFVAKPYVSITKKPVKK